MKIHNINLSDKHLKEISDAISENEKSLKNEDTILELSDDTRVLVIYRMNMFLCQYLDNLV